MATRHYVYTLALLVCFSEIAVHCNPVTTDEKEEDFVYTCTKAGVVKGTKQQDLDLFLGIPFAAPPVGELRFAKPAPVSPWKGVRNALKHGPNCIQRPLDEDPVMEDVPFSEDCLYLDIYSPRSRNESFSDSKLAVMMFIHGGSFYGGTGALYNFTNLALKDVVVVVINYRLGVFGFLSTEDDVIPGNYGILDMVMALDWIKENIGSFGGDPNRITAFGGSAGGTSASLLSLSPLSRGKLHGIITQSGTGISPWGIRNPKSKILTSLGIAKIIGNGLKCSTPKDGREFSVALLACLKQRPAGTILTVSNKLKEKTGTGEIPIWVPVLEKTFGVLPDLPVNLIIRDPSSPPIPTIRGYTPDDASFVLSDPENDGLKKEEFTKLLSLGSAFYFPECDDKLVKAVLETYFQDPSANTSLPSMFETRKIAIKVLTDLLFISPTTREALLFSESKQGSNTYVYEWDIRPSYLTSPLWMGARHQSEKGFVLDFPQGPDPYKYPDHTKNESRIADLVSTMWTNFAKYGNPTKEPVDGLTWEPFVSKATSTHAGSQCESSSKRSPFKPNLRYNVLKIKEVPEMAPFDRCDDVNFWSGVC